MSNLRTLRMRLSLDVLQHLGLNLYSNVPAVLSEIVANAWDADATTVHVTFDKAKDTIVIADNGDGMTRDHVIDRFLLVGYQRRKEQHGLTRLERAPMGRKGIGKLSMFSIARQIVVETAQDRSRTALKMHIDAIHRAIKASKDEYEPEDLPTHGVSFSKGTRITLSDLKKRQTISTTEGLRRRLARRFSIIGPNYDFGITVNGKPVAPEDRGYHHALQYIWTYGDQSSVISLCTNLEDCEPRQRAFEVDGGRTITVDGWLGTVQESGQLRDELGENLNRIAIFVRGKMAQEDLLADFTERGIYASYLIGELRVDGLDTATGEDADGDEDAATSSRERIVEDDPRYIALKRFVAAELKYIQKQWTELRVDSGAQRAMAIPEVKTWIDSLPKEFAGRAKRWLGRINRINMDDTKDRRQLTKHAVIAFEFYRWNKNLDSLEDVSDENYESIVQMFRELDGLEVTLYGQIVRQRIAVIRALQEKVDQNAKERVIQEYIFDHLWLLDPSWERVEASELMEKRVSSLFGGLEAKLSEDEKRARLDIKYRKTAGKHVIVELKRPEVSVSVYDLSKQIRKYRSGMLKILEALGKPHEPVEFVCLLGEPPVEWEGTDGKKTVEDTLDVLNARYVNYDELLENSFQAYSDYLQRARLMDRLGDVIDAIENYGEN